MVELVAGDISEETALPAHGRPAHAEESSGALDLGFTEDFCWLNAQVLLIGPMQESQNTRQRTSEHSK